MKPGGIVNHPEDWGETYEIKKKKPEPETFWDDYGFPNCGYIPQEETKKTDKDALLNLENSAS